MSSVPLNEARGHATPGNLLDAKKLRKGNPVELRPALKRTPLVMPDGTVHGEELSPEEMAQLHLEAFALELFENEQARNTIFNNFVARFGFDPTDFHYVRTLAEQFAIKLQERYFILIEHDPEAGEMYDLISEVEYGLSEDKDYHIIEIVLPRSQNLKDSIRQTIYHGGNSAAFGAWHQPIAEQRRYDPTIDSIYCAISRTSRAKE